MKRVLLLLFLLLLVTSASAANEFPMMIGKMVKGGNTYDGLDRQSFFDAHGFWAKHADYVIAGHAESTTSDGKFFDALKVSSSDSGTTTITLVYINEHYSIMCDDINTDTTDNGWNVDMYNFHFMTDSLGLTYEDYFFHYDDTYDSCVFPVWAGCTGYGDAHRYFDNAVIADSQKRVSQDFLGNDFGDSRWPGGDANILNYYTDPTAFAKARAYGYLRMLNNSSLFFGLDSTPGGLWSDNHDYDGAVAESYIYNVNRGNNMWSYGGATGGDVWSSSSGDMDWAEIAAPMGANQGTAWAAFGTAYSLFADTLTDYGYTIVANVVNLRASRVDDLLKNGAEAVAVASIEFGGNDMINNYWSRAKGQDENADITRLDTLKAYGIKWINEFRYYWDNPAANDTTNSWLAHSAFGTYLVFYDPTLSLFTYNTRVPSYGTGDGDTLSWSNWDLWKINMGDTIADWYTTVDTGLTNQSNSVHLLIREFDSGWAAFLPKEADGSDTSSTEYYTYDFGDGVYVLGENSPGHASDSTFKSDGEVNIQYGHSVIVLKSQGDASPSISDILPASGYVDSTDRITFTATDDLKIDSVTTYIWPPDSASGVNDSIHIHDTTFGTTITEYSPNLDDYDYLWLDSGQTYIVVVAWDSAGQENRDSTLILIDVQQNEAPVISVILPTAVYVDSTERITFTVVDDFGELDSVFCYLWSPSSDSINVYDTVFSPQITTYSPNLADYDVTWSIEGTYYLVIVAVDDPDNVSRDSVQVAVTVPVEFETVVITWKDSVVNEETYVRSNALNSNFGRVTSGGATRVIVNLGPFFSNERISLHRTNTFKDSTDLHTGLIIDSVLLSVSVQSVTVGAGDWFDIETSGIDSIRNWVEGDRNGGEAQDCEVSWDSAQQKGPGSCATAMAWGAAGLRGATDTMGVTGNKVRIDETIVAGDRITFYIDTVVANVWKDNADANEGVCMRFTDKSGNISTALNWYGSETSVSGREDSISTLTLYGHIGEGIGPPQNVIWKRNRLIRSRTGQ